MGLPCYDTKSPGTWYLVPISATCRSTETPTRRVYSYRWQFNAPDDSSRPGRLKRCLSDQSLVCILDIHACVVAWTILVAPIWRRVLHSPLDLVENQKQTASSTRNDGYKAGVPHHGEDVSTNCLPAVAAVCVLDRKACSTSELSLVVCEYCCHGLAQTRGTGRLQASHARAPGCLQRRHHHGGGRQEPAPNRVHQEQGCDRPFQDRSVWSVNISLTISSRLVHLSAAGAVNGALLLRWVHVSCSVLFGPGIQHLRYALRHA